MSGAPGSVLCAANSPGPIIGSAPSRLPDPVVTFVTSGDVSTRMAKKPCGRSRSLLICTCTI